MFIPFRIITPVKPDTNTVFHICYIFEFWIVHQIKIIFDWKLISIFFSFDRIWHARKPLKNFVQKLFHPKTRKLIHHNVCPLPGQQMVKLCLPVTATTPSVYGKFPYQLVKCRINKSRKEKKTTTLILYFVIKVWIKNHTVFYSATL